MDFPAKQKGLGLILMPGYFTSKLMDAPIAFTFFDFILAPSFTNIEPKEVDVSSRFTPTIQLRVPFVSSPMDTVTEEAMAIAMAECGAIGVIHRNCTRERQLEMVLRVKEHESESEYATRDSDGRLACAAAISPFDRARALMLDKYADVLVIDVAHFHNANVMEATRKLMKELSSEIIVGNIGTYEAAVDVITKLENVAGLRVGIGSGSICITSSFVKVGAPTLFATAQVADALREYGMDIPIIADGGIRCPGDAALALTVGASTIMLGNLLARCEEAAGPTVIINGKRYKKYRGMASPSALARRYALDRYSHPSKDIPEGVEGLVPCKGKVKDVLDELVAALKIAMGYVGARSIEELWKKGRLLRVTALGIHELGPHDIILERKEYF